MKEKLFENWLFVNNRPTRYSKTINTISKDLEKVNYKEFDLYSIDNASIVKKIKDDYLSIDEYYQKNKRGQNMYNSALNRYIDFLDNDDILINDIEEIFNSTVSYDTEKRNLVKCRIGQGNFRDKLIKYWKGCSVTSFKNIDILVASHIKPWSFSNNEERLDLYNGLLLTPNLDKLFDKGYISFDDNGRILVSKFLVDFELLGINSNMKINIEKQHRTYLDFHRKKIFKI